MRRERRLISIALGAAGVVLALGLAACGGGSRLAADGAGSPAQPGADQPGAGGAPSGPRTTLRLSAPALAQLAAGSEFTVTLSAETAQPLYQASARLLFDPAQLEPVRAEAARLADSSVALARADAALRMDGRGYVPYAYTGLPGSAPLAPGEYQLLTVRFRVKQALRGNGGLQLLNDPAYLQLRGADSQRLSFDLHEEVAAR
jgi:hypothetical protein